MKPHPMKKYGSYDEWKKDQIPANRKRIELIEHIVAGLTAHLETSVKWGQGCWIGDDGPRFYIHAEPDHVQLGFYNGVALSDPKKLLAGKGKYVRFVRIQSAKDIDENALKALVRQVI